MSERFASSKFADFTNVRELYRSQAGAVFRATFKYDNREYVIKERHLSKQGQTKDIMNEVKLLIQLHHPNVIRCEGWFRDDSRKSIFIVLEYCGGGDLSSVIVKRKSNNGHFEEREIWYIFNQLCDGLKHLHEHGIIHRDLKPLNIMCTASGKTFKIGDLGVSRQVSEDTLMLKSFYGTPLYLSPELVENKLYNEKTDIWSLGVILYELCCLQPPFKGNSLLDVARMVSEGKYAPISNRYSKHMSGCIAWMLNLDFAQRPNVLQLLAFVHKRLSSVKSGDKEKILDSRLPVGPVPDRESLHNNNNNHHNDEEGEGEDCLSDGTEDTRMEDDSLDGKERMHCGNRDERKNSNLNEKEKKHCNQVLAEPSQPVRRRSAASSRPVRQQTGVNSTGKRGGKGTTSGSENDSDDTISDRDIAKKVVPTKGDVPLYANDYPKHNNLQSVAPPLLVLPAVAVHCEPPQPQQRQSLLELRQEKVERKQRQERPVATAVAAVKPTTINVAKSEVQVQVVEVDVQRLQVLLRRESAKLRQLLQARDFAALKIHSDNSNGAQGYDRCELRETPAEAILSGIKSAQSNVKVLDAALAAGGIIATSDAERFGFRMGPSQALGRPEPALPPAESKSSKKKNQVVSTVAPVTALPLRPGEEDPLGIDINADRASGPEKYNSASTGQGLGTRRLLDRVRDERPQLRRSPERKQVSNQNVLQLQYNDVLREPEQGINTAAAQNSDRAHLLFQQRHALCDEKATRKARPTSAGAADGRTQPTPQVVNEMVGGMRDARRRPGTAGVSRLAVASPADRNAERKHELLVKWGASGDDNDDVLAGGGNLALPSVQKMAQQRPRTAVPSAAVVASDNCALYRPGAAAAMGAMGGRRKEDNVEQFNDIMFNNVLRKQRVHRRVKSDVTNPDYVLPTHARVDERKLSVNGAKEVARHSEVQHPAQAPARPPAADFPLTQGLRPFQAEHQEIVLRGAGHHGDGELLPNQRKFKRDTAQNVMYGLS